MPLLHRLLVLILLLSSTASFAIGQQSKPISKDEVSKFLNQNEECPADQPPYFWHADEVDLKADATPQLLVVASTCMTGTAGPDIHSVFSRNCDGELIELPIAEPKDPNLFDNLFGNSNYDLTVEDGLLVASYTDDIERDTPIVIKYKWNGKEFAVVSLHKTGVFRTSYDCSKAQSDVERAICHVDSLAALDRALADAYKSVLARLSGTQRQALISEQRAWLVQRDKSPLYKSWVSQLTEFYQQRIATLKRRAVALPAPIPTAASAQKP
jgi:uncharacterized protein YecT (DUF1311 family)